MWKGEVISVGCSLLLPCLWQTSLIDASTDFLWGCQGLNSPIRIDRSKSPLSGHRGRSVPPYPVPPSSGNSVPLRAEQWNSHIQGSANNGCPQRALPPSLTSRVKKTGLSVSLSSWSGQDSHSPVCGHLAGKVSRAPAWHGSASSGPNEGGCLHCGLFSLLGLV